MNSYRVNISPLSELSDFIKDYPDESLYQQLQILAESFPTHRAIRGDGNCFYRAFAYLYLTNRNFRRYQQAFPPVKQQYFKEDSKIYSDSQFQQKLQYIYNKHISQLPGISDHNERQTRVENMFNEVYQFDELMIGYFRSVNYFHMKKNKANFLPFIRDIDSFEDQLSRVVKFGSQSEGVEIYSLADAMKTKITIFCIDQNGFHPVTYMQDLQDQQFYLFYRPGHYDIVYPQTKLHKQPEKNQGFISSVKKTIINTFKFNKQQVADKKQQRWWAKRDEEAADQDIYSKKSQTNSRYSTRPQQKQNYQNYQEQVPVVQRNIVQDRNRNQRKKSQIKQNIDTNKNFGKFNNRYNMSSSKSKEKQKRQKSKNLQSNPSNLLNQILGLGAITAAGYLIYISFM